MKIGWSSRVRTVDIARLRDYVQIERTVKAMKTLYFWMIFQILIGIWMFISPFVFDFRNLMGASTNNMILGALVVLLGIGVTIYEYYHREVPVYREMEHQRST